MEKLNPNCPCKNTGCPRHGNCAACQAFHHGMEKPSLSSCERLAKENGTDAHKK